MSVILLTYYTYYGKCSADLHGNTLTKDGPIWAWAHTSSTGSVWELDIIMEHDRDRLRHDGKISVGLCVDDDDEWVTPPPEEWPDEVCVFAAKQTLLAPANND